MDITSVVGLVLAFGMICAAIVVDTPLTVFIDVPSLLMVFGGTFALVVFSFPLNEVLGLSNSLMRAFFLPKAIADKYVLGKEPTEDEMITYKRELKFGIVLFKRIPPLVMSTGMVGFVIGIVKIFQSLSDINKIGPAIALALLSIFYSILLSFFISLPIPYKF